MDIELVIDAKAVIGESPTWAADERALYWMDVKEPALFRYDPANGSQRSWRMPSEIGAFALTRNPDGAVVALRDGLFRLDCHEGRLAQLAPPPYDPKLFRFNEGACDDSGRFWVGVMFDPQSEGAPPGKAALHSFTLSGGLRPEPDAAELHNGMAWSPDGRQFYLSHSKKRAIYAYDFDAGSGRIAHGRLFAKIPDGLGVPDGAAVDADGYYWVALHGAGRLRRFAPTGEVDRDILLPVSLPTKCTFGGDGLETLYVTSASDKLTPEQKRMEPHAGALWRLRPGVAGMPRACVVH